MNYGIVGERIRLVPVDWDKHGENCQRWLNNKEITKWLCVGYGPVSMVDERAWFDSMPKQADQIIWAIETLEGQHIGQSGLHRVDLRSGTATSGSFIGDMELWGTGYGTEAAVLRAGFAFHVLGLRRLFSEFLQGNDRSRRMQEKVGYEIWGTKPEAMWKLGQYVDLVQTTLTRERWIELHSKWLSVY